MSVDDQREQRAGLDLDRLMGLEERLRGGWLDASQKYAFNEELHAALPDLIAVARERDQLRATVERVRAVVAEWDTHDPDEPNNELWKAIGTALEGQP